jgi:hypothetical protein
MLQFHMYSNLTSQVLEIMCINFFEEENYVHKLFVLLRIWALGLSLPRKTDF